MFVLIVICCVFLWFVGMAAVYVLMKPSKLFEDKSEILGHDLDGTTLNARTIPVANDKSGKVVEVNTWTERSQSVHDMTPYTEITIKLDGGDDEVVFKNNADNASSHPLYLMFV